MLQWATTSPRPYGRPHTHGADAGQRGWKLHLITPGARTRKSYRSGGEIDIDVSRALCGIEPRHGWGLDMFIDAPCARCEAAAEKQGLEVPKI